jgi:macrodomain Ter protein organizer (MatP/YcbG family)
MSPSSASTSQNKSTGFNDSVEEAYLGSYDVIQDLVREMTKTQEKEKEHQRKQDDFSRRVHKQVLTTRLNKAFNSDLRANSVTGVDGDYNVWQEMTNFKNTIAMRGLCHQEIGRMITSTKAQSRDHESQLFEQMKKRLDKQTGQALFNFNKSLNLPELAP